MPAALFPPPYASPHCRECSPSQVGKLCYVLANLFSSLLSEGYCTPKQGKEESEGGKGGKFEECEGTGMGEGEGKRDVSDKIEDEGQLTGTKDEQQVRGREGGREG